jgi:hypothetical protein
MRERISSVSIPPDNMSSDADWSKVGERLASKNFNMRRCDRCRLDGLLAGLPDWGRRSPNELEQYR